MNYKVLLVFCFVLLNSCSNESLWKKKEAVKEKNEIVPVKINPDEMKSCLNGDGRFCLGIGNQYLQANQNEKAFRHYLIGCNLDLGAACTAAGKLSIEQKQHDIARTFYEKGCQLKHGHSCLELALEKLALGQEQEGKTYLLHSCDFNDRDGCLKLGEFFFVHGETKRSFYFFRRSCDLGHSGACYDAGQMQIKMGNQAKATEYSLIACDRSEPTACYNLACHFSRQNDIEKGLFYFERSLNYGFNDWNMIEFDPDLKLLRNTSKFSSLVSFYRMDSINDMQNSVRD